MSLNLGTILQASAADHAARPALRLGPRVVTYAELDRAARGVAAGLHARGIEPGDAVGIMVPNVPEFTIAYFGVLYAGCTVVPLNVLLSAPEVTYHLQDSGAKLLVAHPLFQAPAAKGAATGRSAARSCRRRHRSVARCVSRASATTSGRVSRRQTSSRCRRSTRGSA